MLMKPKDSFERTGRNLTGLLSLVKILIFSAALILVACLRLLPLLAMEITRIVGSVLGGFLAGLESLAALTSSLLVLVTYAAWLVFLGEWGQLVILLPHVLEWLRSAGLM